MRRIDTDIVTYVMERCLKIGKCLVWQKAKNKDYGAMQLPGTRKSVLAHKALFEAVHGIVPAGFVVMHSCDNPLCCNINHLSLGTHKRNVNDASAKGRKTNTGNGFKSKLNGADHKKIKELSKILTDHDIGKLYKVSASCIQRIRLGKTKVWKPGEAAKKAAEARWGKKKAK